MSATLILLNFLVAFDNDAAAGMHFLNGFLFAFCLYFSLRQKPNRVKATVGVAILGVLNIFVFYSAAPAAYLVPENLTTYFFFAVPSVVGAGLTLAVVRYVWGNAFPLSLVYLAGVFTLIGSILAIAIAQHLYKGQNPGFLLLATNSGAWILAFCFALFVVKANK